MDDLSARFAEIPTGQWQVTARQALVTPLARQKQQRPAGFLVIGVNPQRKLDADYRGFWLEVEPGRPAFQTR